MKTKTCFALLCLGFTSAGMGCLQASPLIYTSAFPSSQSTVVASVGTISPGNYGAFWSASRGDSISQNYIGTGLTSVNQLSLDFPVTQNRLLSEVDWNVSLNGNLIGSWAWTPANGSGEFTATYNFADIIGNGSYQLVMSVANEVPSGNGSITISFPGSLTLEAVPEPETGVLLSGAAACLWRKFRPARR